MKFTIKHKVDNKTYSIKILDSYCILTDSLKDLCIKYDLDKDLSKGDFPHEFASADTLFYLGCTPVKNYHPLSLSEDEYKQLKKDI